jgi:uncharacterized protein YqgQ
MRLRASRLEFAQKEAIHFISLALKNYQEETWSASGLSASPPASPGLNQQFVECSKYALQYLKSAQAPGINGVPGMATDFPGANSKETLHKSPPSSHVENQTFVLLKDTQVSTRSPKKSSENLDSSINKSQSRTMDDRKPTPFSSSNDSRAALSKEFEVAGSEQDLSTPEPKANDANLCGASSFCSGCRSLGIQLDQSKDTIESLHKEISSLHCTLNAELLEKSQILTAKNILETEMEELTAQLFDQANKMVEEEAKLRDALELANKGLSRKLNSKDEEFHALKRTLAIMENSKAMKGGKMANESAVHSPVYVGPSALSSNNSINLEPTFVDGLEMNQFQDFIRRLLGSVMVQNGNAIFKLDGDPFVRRCTSEDIEACLFSSSHSGVATAAFASLPNSFKKKLMESLFSVSADVKPLENANQQGKERKCALCGLQRDCTYSVRLQKGTSTPGPLNAQPNPQYIISLRGLHLSTSSASALASDELSASYYVDRFCANRIECALDLCRWLISLRQEKNGAHRPVIEIFRTYLWYRRKMAEARIGSIDLFRHSQDKDALLYSNIQIST